MKHLPFKVFLLLHVIIHAQERKSLKASAVKNAPLLMEFFQMKFGTI